MFAAGSMRPEWCFVAQEEGEDHPLGRVAFWTLPGMGEPFEVALEVGDGNVHGLVEDDGEGFDPEAVEEATPSWGVGLGSMRRG